MAFTIKWREKSLDTLRKLPKVVAKRIVIKMGRVKDDPFRFLEKLTNDPGYKVRVGDYRIIVDVEGDLLLIRLVGHRRNIYKRNL